jgi:hypothetical protein
MRPFTATEVARYLLWIVLGLALAAILAWYIFLSPGRERIHPGTQGATARLHLPEPQTVR